MFAVICLTDIVRVHAEYDISLVRHDEGILAQIILQSISWQGPVVVHLDDVLFSDRSIKLVDTNDNHIVAVYVKSVTDVSTKTYCEKKKKITLFFSFFFRKSINDMPST